MQVFLHTCQTRIGNVDSVQVALHMFSMIQKAPGYFLLHEQHHRDTWEELPVEFLQNRSVKPVEFLGGLVGQQRILLQPIGSLVNACIVDILNFGAFLRIRAVLALPWCHRYSSILVPNT